MFVTLCRDERRTGILSAHHEIHDPIRHSFGSHRLLLCQFLKLTDFDKNKPASILVGVLFQ
ncbi:hypothetical protein KGO95_03355 [Patescibacteria group bacterium]|nr:hypothetical protein [Patescibacteria group bacterium]